MEIGPLQAHELAWMLARSARTAWEQLTAAEQAGAAPAQVAQQAAAMVAGALGRPGGAALVAREGGQPAGYILVDVQPHEITGAPQGVYLDIWVEPAWRRRGVAGALCAAADQHCRSLGLRQTRRLVSAHNTASLELSLRQGNQIQRLVLGQQL